ncbi:MAG: hypothetical protein HYX63_21580 [Gammaproteobacteria bacterium]|nr:hypothetical protein [Gammaproteobacteria bacterium]
MSLFKAKAARSSQLGVCAVAHGITAALVRPNAEGAPELQWARHVETADVPGALSALAHQSDTRNVNCASLVQAGDYSLVLVEAPDVPPAELRAAVRWRVNELIDFHVDDAVIDIFDIPSANDTRSNRIYAIAARTTAVRQVATDLTDAGFKLEAIDIPEFALRNIAALCPEDLHGVAMVALERERGLVTLTRQSALFLSRRLDYGSARLFGENARDSTTVLEGAMDTLVIEIQRSLDYYERHFAQPPIQGVVFAPCGVEISGACAYLQSQLGLPVRNLDLNDVFQPATRLDAITQARCCGAIGTALRREEVAL